MHPMQRKTAETQKTGISHDVSFVNSGNFLSAVFHGIVKCKLGNAAGLGASDNLQRLHNTRNTLTLKQQFTTHQSKEYD